MTNLSRYQNIEKPIKVIVIGDSAAGKTKLMSRYLKDDYNNHTLSTFALNVYSTKVSLRDLYSVSMGNEKLDEEFNNITQSVFPDGSINIEFWDTAGQEKFNNVHPSYYYRADSAIYVFDVTRKTTYKNLELWRESLSKYTNADNTKSIPQLVIANKIDLVPESTECQFQFAIKNNFDLFFCSAADGTNVVLSFLTAVKRGVYSRLTKSGENDLLSELYDIIEKR